jgi:hypothetical protein
MDDLEECWAAAQHLAWHFDFVTVVAAAAAVVEVAW